MPDNSYTVVGNLTAAPEIKFTSSGAAVANVTIAHTPRVYNKAGEQWEDGETLFLRGSLWREAAENLAESLTRGARVIATGKLKQRSFETKEGDKRSVIEMDIEEIGPSLRYATARVEKSVKGSKPPSGFADPNTDEPPF